MCLKGVIVISSDRPSKTGTGYRMKHAFVIFGIAFVALAVIVPIVIHSWFDAPAATPWSISEWTAGDILSYCGGVLGAAATMAAVVLTIRFSSDEMVESQRLAAVPCIALQSLRDYRGVLLKTPEKLDRDYLIPDTENREIAFYSDLDPADSALFLKSGSAKTESSLKWNDQVDLNISIVVPSISIGLKVISVGNGPALNVSYALCDRDGNQFTYNGREAQSATKQMMVEQSAFLGLLFKGKSSIYPEPLYLTIKYEDTLGNHYQQLHEIRLYSVNGEPKGCSVDLKICRELAKGHSSKARS